MNNSTVTPLLRPRNSNRVPPIQNKYDFLTTIIIRFGLTLDLDSFGYLYTKFSILKIDEQTAGASMNAASTHARHA